MGGSPRRVRTVVVLAVLVAVAIVLGRGRGAGLVPRPPDREARDLVAPATPTTPGPYRFTNKDPDGRPVGFDPCRTIHYVVRVGPGPLNGAALVADGVARLERATGLRFQYDGTTDEVPTSSSRFSADDPVFIGWAAEDETDLFSRFGHEVIGVAGSQMAGGAGDARVYRGGYVVLKPYLNLVPGFGPGRSEGNVLLHELGHLAGLDHVDDPGEQMAPGVGPQAPADYGPGDRQGLYRLGASRGCA